MFSMKITEYFTRKHKVVGRKAIVPYAAGGLFGQYLRLLKPWHMGTYLRVLGESFVMNTNLTGFKRFSKIFVSIVFGRK